MPPSGLSHNGTDSSSCRRIDDFSGRASLYGAPPKVIWLTVGNCSTDEIERRLRDHRETIEAFALEPDSALLVIGLAGVRA